MIQNINDSAEAVGITAVITDSEKKIETQLNSLTRDGDVPLMLVSWDIDTSLEFDQNGFLKNPSSNIVALLVSKPLDSSKIEAEDMSNEMGTLFQTFIKDLYDRLIPLQKDNNSPLSNISYKLVPRHGMGKHSGILAKWTMNSDVVNCT